jgi:Spy/CpxP family protein refolding chaperone
MTKNKILILLVAVLLLANITLLYFFLNKPQHNKGGRQGREAAMTAFLEKEIGFSPQQLKQYDSLGNTHRETMRVVLDSMRNAKELLLKQLAADNFTDSAMVQAADQSAGKQREMELAMLRHFKSIRNLCTPAQQPKFDSLYYKMMWRRGGMRQPGGKKN